MKVKKITRPVARVIDIKPAQEVRILSALLVLQAVISYRNVPRTLELLKNRSRYPFQWISHLTSVIN